MALTNKEKKQRFDAKEKLIRHRIKLGISLKIKGICKRDKIMYHGLFCHVPLWNFYKERKVNPRMIILIMLMDLYESVTWSDVKVWGLFLTTATFYNKRKELTEMGYIDSYYIGQTNKKHHFLTVKGKAFVKEFNQYYDNYVKNILKTKGYDTEQVRKITRTKPARVYKPRYQFTSKQLGEDRVRRDTGDTG